MTLRDLSKRQLYNLRRRCNMHLRKWTERTPAGEIFLPDLWNAAYNAGLKDGLAIKGERTT